MSPPAIVETRPHYTQTPIAVNECYRDVTPECGVALRLLRSEMTIEELHDDIVSFLGFWNVWVVKETVEQSLPDV